MSFAEVYLVAFCFGAGVSIAGFWGFVVANGLLPSLISSRRAALNHVAAEFLSAASLLATGSAVLLAPDASWVDVLAGVSLGTLIYALFGSPGLYEDRRVLGAFAIGWLFTIPAIIALFASI